MVLKLRYLGLRYSEGGQRQVLQEREQCVERGGKQSSGEPEGSVSGQSTSRSKEETRHKARKIGRCSSCRALKVEFVLLPKSTEKPRN